MAMRSVTPYGAGVQRLVGLILDIQWISFGLGLSLDNPWTWIKSWPCLDWDSWTLQRKILWTKSGLALDLDQVWAILGLWSTLIHKHQWTHRALLYRMSNTLSELGWSDWFWLFHCLPDSAWVEHPNKSNPIPATASTWNMFDVTNNVKTITWHRLWPRLEHWGGAEPGWRQCLQLKSFKKVVLDCKNGLLRCSDLVCFSYMAEFFGMPFS